MRRSLTGSVVVAGLLVAFALPSSAARPPSATPPRSATADYVGGGISSPVAAVPSQYDLEHLAPWPTMSYVVVSVREGKAADLRSWELEADRSRFNEEEVARVAAEEPSGKDGDEKKGGEDKVAVKHEE